jgi:hypothetical protein
MFLAQLPLPPIADPPPISSPSVPANITPTPTPSTPPTSTPPTSTPPTSNLEAPPKSIDRPNLLDALNKTTQRYPALANPLGDRIPESPTFTLHQNHQIKFNLRSLNRSNQIQDITIHRFKPEDQVYWVLPGNRIVIETLGWEGGIRPSGTETKIQVQQQIQATQSLWGLQAAWVIPQGLQDLISRDELNMASILSIAGEAINPDGSPAPTLTLDSGSQNNSNPNRRITSIPRIGTASTYSPSGGGALFENLALGTSPLILQAFPTNNLQALLEGNGLFVGAVISAGVLDKAGIKFGNPITGEGFEFRPEVTSIPGIKVAQASQFDNLDLLNVLINPYLDQDTRQFDYLNSLHWISLGLRDPKILSTVQTTQTRDWTQFFLNRPHNRTLLQYDREPRQATYTNIFSNPGIALSYSFDRKSFNEGESANATIGHVLGTIFEWIKPFRLEKSIWEGKVRARREEPFTLLKTTTTPEERKQINQRLERTLILANRTSGIDDLSGSITFPTPIFSDRNALFQLRVGNHIRRQSVGQIDRTWADGPTFISKLKLSNETFGPLTFIGNPIFNDNLTAINTSNAVQVIITTADGSRQLQIGDRISGTPGAVLPVSIRSFTNAFDRIDLSQIGLVTTNIDRYEGDSYLPTIEAVLTGSKANFNYSYHAGLWVNFANQLIPNVRRADFGQLEGRFGLYMKGLWNWESARAIVNQDQKVSAIVMSNPSLNLSLNSASNPSNPSTLTASYSYLRQSQPLTMALTGGALLSYTGKTIEPVIFGRGQLSFQNGLAVTAAIDVSTQMYGSLEAMVPISAIWSGGIYGQNFSTGLTSANRSTGSSYGVILQNLSGPGRTGLTARVGFSNGQPEMRFEGRLKI